MAVFDDCIAYWNLDEASGQTRADTVGSFHLADASGDVSAYSGQINNGARADGSGSLIANTSPPSTTFGYYGFSMAGWFRILSDANTDTHDILTITLTNSHTMTMTFNDVSNKYSVVLSDGTSTSTESIPGTLFTASGWRFISAQWRGTTFYATLGATATQSGLSTAALTTGQSLVSVEYEAGTVAIDEFLAEWQKRGDGFENDPPNAALSLSNDDVLVFERTDPVREGGSVRYTARLLPASSRATAAPRADPVPTGPRAAPPPRPVTCYLPRNT